MKRLFVIVLVLLLIDSTVRGQVPVNPVSISGSATSVSTGLINVLSLAPGITISDGNAHTISSAPSGTVFHGLTTLAQVAAVKINGTTPFSFITSSPFNTAGVYNLSNTDVPNLDIAWLAIEAGFQTGKTYIPAGIYEIGTIHKLPLMIPLNFVNNGPVSGNGITIQGDGEELTIIQAATDFGALSAPIGVPLIACGDPNGTVGNSLGRYSGNTAQCAGNFQDMRFIGPSGTGIIFTIGTTPVAMDGIAMGSQLRTKDIMAGGFLHDWTIVGDHTLYIRPRAIGGTHGFYWPAQAASHTGDLDFISLLAANQSIGSLTASPTASISGDFEGETYLQAPYAFFGETGCSVDMVLIASFSFLKTEFVGNAFMHDENGFSGGVYTDSNKCRNVSSMRVGDYFGNYANSNFWGGSGRGRRASFDVNGIGMTIDHLIMNGAQFSPAAAAAAPSGPSPLSTLEINSGIDENSITTKVRGSVATWISQSSTLPLVAGPAFNVALSNSAAIGLEETGVWTGLITNWTTEGNYTTTAAGDIFQVSNFAAVPSGFNQLQGNIGVVMQGGIATGGAVPIATGGQKVNASTYWQSVVNGAYKSGTGVGGKVTITAAGTSGTTGSFGPIAATGGGCGTEPTFNFTVAGGSITAASWVTYGATCTSAPTMPTTASGGLSGATLTAQWPAAMAVPVVALTDGNILGSLVNSNSPGSGNNLVVLYLNVH